MLGLPSARLAESRMAKAVALSEGRMTLRDSYVRVGRAHGQPVDPDAAVARHWRSTGRRPPRSMHESRG